MKAVIMAGGKGTRLRPLTCSLPKPMVPIANRPMMEYIVRLLKEHGFTEVLATLFYLPEAIQNHFGDGHDFGMEIRYLLENNPLGTAGSVKNGEDFLDETFLVISGDTLTDIHLREAVEFHRSKGATATLILTKVANPLEYGVVITDSEWRIRRFLEKPGWGEVFSDTVNTGIYILDPKVFKYFKKGQVFDFSKDLFPLMLGNGEPLFGYVASGYWSDIGNLDQYRQAHNDILTGKVRAVLPGHEYRPGIWVGKNPSIDRRAELEAPLILGDDCRVEAGARIGAFTVIGKNCVIQENASTKRSILWDHCYVGDNSELRGAILCHHAYLKGKNSVFEGAVLGDSVSLGSRAAVKPQVKIWPSKDVESGATVNESLIWAKKSSRSLFGNSGICGGINHEITPEIAAKLGAVFGAHLKSGSRMVVSCDDYRPSRIFKRALVAGALSAGVGVYDLGSQVTPLTRYALVALEAKGGVHIRINPQDPEGLLLEFFDDQGLNLSKSAERSLENAYFSEDFPRVPPGEMGELTFVPQLIEPYLQGLLDREIRELIKEVHFRIVAAYDRSSLAFFLPEFLKTLECRVHQIEASHSDRPRTFAELLETVRTVAEEIKTSRADLGLIVDSSAERLLLLDGEGNLVKDQELVALLSYLVLKYRPEATVPVQVTAPQFIEELAREFHGRVVRTKASPRSLMERVAEERLFPNGDGSTSYHPQFDALFSFSKILELLARERISLREALALIPRVERGYAEVDCPWERKGLVMRNLFEENKEKQLEMTDGLKVYHDEGWALVLPDAEEPIFKIYSEAGTPEEADALTRLYMSRINELQLQ